MAERIWKEEEARRRGEEEVEEEEAKEEEKELEMGRGDLGRELNSEDNLAERGYGE